MTGVAPFRIARPRFLAYWAIEGGLIAILIYGLAQLTQALTRTPYADHQMLTIVVASLLFSLVLLVSQGSNLGEQGDLKREIVLFSILCVICGLLAYGILGILLGDYRRLECLLLLEGAVAVPVTIAVWRWLSVRFDFLNTRRERVVIVGSGELARQVCRWIHDHHAGEYAVIGFADADDARAGQILAMGVRIQTDFAHLARFAPRRADRIIVALDERTGQASAATCATRGPASDSIPAMIALGAICAIAGPGGTREVPVESFCTGKEQNVLQPGELLVEVRFPQRPPHSGSHYRRFIPRNEMDIAVVGVGASVVLDEGGENFVSARIGLGAVAPTPLIAQEASDLLAGQPAGDETITKAAEVRMGGPREALWHAIIRKNHGVSHLIVGRDHAGPGSDAAGEPFYGPYEAQDLLREYEDEIGVQMVPFRMMVYVPDQDRYQPIDEVGEDTRTLSISGTELRERLADGREIPRVVQLPRGGHRTAQDAPASLPAGPHRLLHRAFRAPGSRRSPTRSSSSSSRWGGRPVTLLDGDIVRQNLSSETRLLEGAPRPEHHANRVRGVRDHQERRDRALRSDRTICRGAATQPGSHRAARWVHPGACRHSARGVRTARS